MWAASTDLQFDPNDPQRVIVTLQVQPGLNIREDSVASIDSQGLTGGTYVEISGGTAKSPILVGQGGPAISRHPHQAIHPGSSWSNRRPRWWPSSMSRRRASTTFCLVSQTNSAEGHAMPASPTNPHSLLS